MHPLRAWVDRLQEDGDLNGQDPGSGARKTIEARTHGAGAFSARGRPTCRDQRLCRCSNRARRRAKPRPDTLKAIAEVLGLDLADIYTAAGYVQSTGLPSFTPYLRSKYADMPPKALQELETSFARIAEKYGYERRRAKSGTRRNLEPTEGRAICTHHSSATLAASRRA